mmetsp:Transcript_18099/g.45747  ORF Transcript_18099/g.45747 Transcript_18099/m.45747 type:complete len:129 (+) Transcript_18099:320-706(+)
MVDNLAKHQFRNFVGHSEDVSSACFSPNGRLVATGSSEPFFCTLGRMLIYLDGPQGCGLGGRVLLGWTLRATASKDATVKIWDASSGTCTRTLAVHGLSLYSATFSRDNSMILTSSNHGVGRLLRACP